MNSKMAAAARCRTAAHVPGILNDALLRVGPRGVNATNFALTLAACLGIISPAGIANGDLGKSLRE